MAGHHARTQRGTTEPAGTRLRTSSRLGAGRGLRQGSVAIQSWFSTLYCKAKQAGMLNGAAGEDESGQEHPNLIRGGVVEARLDRVQIVRRERGGSFFEKGQE